MQTDNEHVRALALAVFAANGRLVSAGNELVAHLGLTSAWWQVLAALRYAPAPLPAASIARNMGLTRQAVQRIVDVLAEQGLVEFQPNPHHLRAKLVVLTRAGIKAVNGAENAVAPVDQAIADKIGINRIRDAVRMLEEMSAVISEYLGEAPSASSSIVKLQE
ncbi:MarR family transcriptional regulator [Xanthomonas campestris pv. lawsoniae]|uniref:MarR family winged helix-turn-helix transcriptional regulator n=1 Tax=Xanthomonas euvesicatoria TaxID=456327 RepID=UPI001C44CFCF|nr:helix-turn-helix domain-containing protein [Xanthomonas euvesicatoria]MBV6801310.1 MarR family transcriptional regulator [Xanthomonas campestris pv. lawsoniae]MBV6830187.1 MarR family transcriptional regulator [Xanthomonas campestris pv. viegasii]MCC8914494.1 MarR family transcriptional regulator [Xanthomonas euvesicatoria]MCP3048196.1 MarR family transcriptional regulator [Xanthomonas euvesicatoria pv. allii]